MRSDFNLRLYLKSTSRGNLTLKLPDVELGRGWNQTSKPETSLCYSASELITSPLGRSSTNV